MESFVIAKCYYCYSVRVVWDWLAISTSDLRVTFEGEEASRNTFEKTFEKIK